MAKGLVFYVLAQADVNLLAQIGAGRRVGLLPLAAGEEYPAMVVRNPVNGDSNLHDLLVFVDGTTPYFCRERQAGAGQAGTFNAVAQKTPVG
ncbi:hypothetical protein [Nocardioides mangrovi]|uniref:Uncharacterized protein n=1 Tax=Nocardioides mangrovi TaxID=2874580 RepID=A0ABS7UFI3_9ACTN|nr:hypothetical protein [Nocardioides mangrovi]MBZ5739766.1 hypothetical protein [Nocardioides mangrovi]